ncbi:MAG: glycosyltransferase family 2 protein [Candidatus Komeilibacteria bacterium]|nr:glycosyltransferase family 2 protein [Candidatus Komeilibacteria bacterium]
MPILSIIIPVFNERSTVETLINKLKAVVFPGPVELIIVDDGSTDGTVEVLKQLSGIDVVLYHDYNQGKGMAIRTGLVKASGEYVVIQDADLEYDPNDLAIMLQEMIDRGLSVLYGSRNLLHGRNKSAGLTYYTGGVFLSWLTNILYGQKITDEPTCYKMLNWSIRCLAGCFDFNKMPIIFKEK